MKHGESDIKDYEYYKDEMNRGPVPVIESQGAMEENIMLGRMITWLPRQIIKLFKKSKKDKGES